MEKLFLYKTILQYVNFRYRYNSPTKCLLFAIIIYDIHVYYDFLKYIKLQLKYLMISISF